MNSQTIIIDSTFTSDAEIYPFSPNDTITGLSISGSIELNSDTSLVRVILVDEDYNEYMVYEAYPMIVTDSTFDIVEECDETCYLNEVKPLSIKVYIIEAELSLDSCNLSYDNSPDNLDSLRYESKRVKDFQKTQIMNQNIAANGWNWTAGDNNLLEAYYSQKIILFGGNYNLQGFDYYIEGYFDYYFQDTTSLIESTLVTNFDWRSIHDANVPGSKYDFSSNGWLTTVKDQELSCGSCWVFGPVGSMEAITNLYFNGNLAHDYSEKNILCCQADYYNNCNGGFPETSLSYLYEDGAINDNCQPYSPFSDDCCDSVCPTPDLIHKIDGYHLFNANELTQANIKKKIIQRGPLVAWIYSSSLAMNHVMALVGFEINPFNDKHYWIFKDSYGSNQNFDGYKKMIVPTNDFEEIYYIETPIYQTGTSYEINKLDLDMDGYYNWGIQNYDYMFNNGWESPCDTNRDSNDNYGRIGRYDTNFKGVPVKPKMNVYLGHPDFGGIQIENNGFVYFNEADLQNNKISIYIENSGNAYINLNPFTPVIELQDINGCFDPITGELETQVCWNNPDNYLTTFDIWFDPQCQVQDDNPPLAVYKIDINQVDEDVLEDFEFAVIYYNCGSASGTYVVPANEYEVWSDYKVMTKDVKIETGATLEITGNVEFTEESDIYVDGGAELLIDGGVLSGACEEFWNGIDVWGDGEYSQYDGHQGRVKIKNGGTIKHAICGIETGREVPGYYIPSGGIVQSYGGVFEDNIIGVRFHPYHNFYPPSGDPANNLSKFKDTEFVITQNIYNMGEEPVAGVELLWVEGILFKGNAFKNIAITANGEYRGIGIKSATAGFYVDNECSNPNVTPCTEDIISRFEHLDYGIKVLGERESLTIMIDSAIFIDNLRGILMSGVNDACIIRNQFDMNIEGSFHDDGDYIVGAYFEACRDFVLEENVFTAYGGLQLSFGVHTLSLGPYYNEIYNNYFNNVYIGITAVGENRNGTLEGLCIKCNDFISCNRDIFITPRLDIYGNPIITLNTGIAINQGVPNSVGGSDNTLAAGNTFSEDNGTDPNYTNDDGCNHIDYIYHGINQTDKRIMPLPVEGDILPNPDEDATYTKLGSCPSNLGGGIDVPGEKSTLATEAVLVSSYKDTLAMNIDGGDTESLNFDVFTSLPPEALQMRQELLNESPYLSDTVMKTAIYQENVLPNAMIRDVLVANPQSAKSSSVMQTLDQRFDPMPDYMMAEIMQGQNVYSAKEFLERKLAKHKSIRFESLSNLIRYYKSDTLNIFASTDSLIYLLQSENYPASRYQLGMLYMNQNDSTNAFATLNNIPVEFDLTQQEQDIHDLYSDLFDILWHVTSDTIPIDSLQTQILYNISDNYRELPGIYARNILINNGLMTYNEPVYLPNLLQSMPAWGANTITSEHSNILHVFPNPAGYYFIVHYNLNIEMKQPSLIVTDANGKIIHILNLKDKENQVVISMNNYPSGIYVVHLYDDSKLIESAKVIITK